MKRRTFLSAAGTLGIVGAASSTTLATAAYHGLSAQAALKEFTPLSKTTLDGFVKDLAQNLADYPYAKDLIHRTATPLLVMDKKITNKQHQIVYKNKAGQYITLTTSHKQQSVKITTDLPKL